MLQKLRPQNKSLYIIHGIQLLILAAVVLIFLLHRGNAYTKIFTIEEFQLTNQATADTSVIVDEASADEGVFLRTPALSLPKGNYRITINYDAEWEDSEIRVLVDNLASLDFHCTPALLSPDAETGYLTLELARGADEVIIEADFSGSGTLRIDSIGIYETSAPQKRLLVHGLILCAALYFVYYFIISDRTRRQVILALSGIFLVSCYPLFQNYLIAGDDIPFHLLRIEGIAAGLSQGIFPVKIHPVWAQDYGYAVGVFYGDFALYLPAFLRLMGFSVQSAYQYFVAAIQLATVVVSYLTFKRMFQSRKIGVLGSMLYSLSLYRLIDVYSRASVGEYTALLFFPVVFCGFYLILTEGNRTNWWKFGFLTALGLTGLIQSHVLSCEMTIFFIVITCVLCIRSVIKPYRFLALSWGAVLTVLLNLGFLVPFLNYFNESITIHSPEWTGSTDGTIQDTGLFPLQLFTLFQNSNGGTWAADAGIHNEATFGMGIAFLLGMGLFVYLLLCCRRECEGNHNFKPACFSFGLGCLALWMSTCYFPWDGLAAASPVLNKLIVSLEFPWRMLAPAVVLLTFVSCFAFSRLWLAAKEYTPSILCGCLVLALINTGWYYYDLCFHTEPYHVYDTYELDSMAMYSNDYLPAGTDPKLITEGKVLTEGKIFIEDYHKKGTKILCRVTAEDDGFIDFPLNYYEHYSCFCLENNEELPVSAGTNNMVRVSVPGGFTGNIEVSFREPLHWRISEAVSLLTLLSCLTAYGFTFKEKSLRSKEKLGL